MSLGDALILLVILCGILFSVHFILKNGVDACNGDCNGSCHNSCKWAEDINRAHRHILLIKKIKSFFR